MTDIDFDELDKAVNSLMGTVASKDDDGDEPKQKTLNINTTLKPDEKPSYEKIEKVAQGIGSETLVGQGERTTVEALGSKLSTSEMPIAELDTLAATHDNPPVAQAPVPVVPVQVPVRPAAPATRRPSGRFMDVVHPSSDMRTATTSVLAAVSKPVAVVAPVVESASEPTPEAPAPVEVEPVLPAPVADAQPEIAAPVASITPDTMLATPFLPDAKVEKRPLGEPNIAPVEALVETSSPADSLPVIETVPAPEVVPQAELATIEASEEVHDIKADETAPTEIQSQAETIPKDTPITVAVREVESGDTGQLSGGSIAPQYKEKTEETPQTGGAIYDVKDYHKPLAHPAKQKSGWGVVVVIVIIIVVSVVLATGAYFFLNMGA